MDALEQSLAGVFSKLPAWPPGFIEFLRKFYPWLLLIGSALSTFFILAALGIGAVATLFEPVHGTQFMIIMVLHGIRAVLGILAGLQMIKGSRQGWVFAFYSCLIAVLISVIDISIGGLIGDFLMLWGLFQLRPYFDGDGGDSGTSSF